VGPRTDWLPEVAASPDQVLEVKSPEPCPEHAPAFPPGSPTGRMAVMTGTFVCGMGGRLTLLAGLRAAGR